MTDPAEPPLEKRLAGIRSRLRERSARPVSSYELFIFFISIFSLFVLVPANFSSNADTRSLFATVNFFISLVLLVDFFIQFARAPKKLAFLKWGWIDFLGSLPLTYLGLFRLFRIVRIMRTLFSVGVVRIVHSLFSNAAESLLYTTFFAMIVNLTVCSWLVFGFESADPRANIKTPQEALWWSVVTATTVGYGDYVPVTQNGRVVGVFTMASGVALISVLTSYLAQRLVRPPKVTDDPNAAIDAKLDEIIALLRDQPYRDNKSRDQ